MELANALREYDDNHRYDEEIKLNLGHSTDGGGLNQASLVSQMTDGT